MNPPASEAEKSRILIVDDDLRMRELLLRYLTEQGFAAEAVADGTAMDKRLERHRPDLMVLDLMLPGESGLQICSRLRGKGDALPVIMLTAKGDDIDRIIGLEMGADDYLPKPFNPRELVARIQAVLRRRAPSPGAAAGAHGDVIRFGDFELDLAARQLRRQGQALPLTTGEFSLLKALTTHARQPLSRDRLMELTRGREHDVFDRSVDVQVSRLRRLVEADPGHPRYIQTVWGHGYVFVPDGSKAEPDAPRPGLDGAP